MRGIGLVLVLLVVALTACGSKHAKGPTAQQFRTRANAVCKRYDEKLKAVFRQQSATPRAIARDLARAIPLVEQGNRELRAIQAPAELAPRYRRWLALDARSLPVVRRLRDSAANEDVAGFRADLALLTRQERQQSALARTLGLDVCARG